MTTFNALSRLVKFSHAGAASRSHAVLLRFSQTAPLPHAADAWMRLERVAGASDSDQGKARREREVGRPVTGGVIPGIRVLQLQYGDGIRDLLVVGDRALYDQQALQHVTMALLSGDEVPGRGDDGACLPAPAQVQRLAAAMLSPIPQRLDGKEEGGSGRIVCTMDVDVTPSQLLCALAVVLGRCHGAINPAVAVAGSHPSRGADSVQGLSATAYRLVELGIDHDAYVADAVRQMDTQLASAPWITEALLAGMNASASEPRMPEVGIQFIQPVPAAHAGAMEYQYVSGVAACFPLTLSLGDAGRAELSCMFDRTRYSAATVGWLLRSWAHVASQIANSAGSLNALSVLPGEAEREVAALGCRGGLQPTASLRIEDAFAHQVVSQPGAIAVTHEGMSLTYAELDALSRRMATVLASHGVVVGSFVGLCLPRSLPVVAVMLAILRCGATYVPMDPQYPEERLLYTTQDAALALVISPAGRALPNPAVASLTIDALMQSAESADLLPAAEGLDDAQSAYIIYTSGSTGRPKGVVVPHRNVLDLIRATRQEFALSPSDTWTLFHSTAFDFSVWEIWGCLLTGGHLVVVPHEVSRDPEQLRALIQRHAVSVLNQTPSAFYQLVDADQREAVGESLRLIIFGGEALDTRLLLPWFDRHPSSRCRLVNMFGITETTVHVTWQDIGRGEALCGSRSVGPALPGWHLYVMDPQQRLLPPGCAGEIYVGGAGVATCYHNRPELTASRFLPDPYAAGVMYRSGDAGRLHHDGTLEHLGRLDSQVKLRGFRIELDEIRRVLLEYPDVTAAAVLLNQFDPRDPATAQIDAYLVADSVEAGALRQHAANLLPDHMIPATYTRIEHMPMTINGKLDVAQLRTLQAADAAMPRRGDIALPADADADSDAARLMLSIWQDVMGKNVEMDDNFFDLGGNSLVAIRIASAMRKQGLPPLAMGVLYTHQTVRRLVAAIAPA